MVRRHAAKPNWKEIGETPWRPSRQRMCHTLSRRMQTAPASRPHPRWSSWTSATPRSWPRPTTYAELRERGRVGIVKFAAGEAGAERDGPRNEMFNRESFFVTHYDDVVATLLDDRFYVDP